MTSVKEVIDRLNEFQTVTDLETFFLNEGVTAPPDGGITGCLVAKYVREKAQMPVTVGYLSTTISGYGCPSFHHSSVLEQFIESFDMGGLNYRLYEKEKKDGTAA